MAASAGKKLNCRCRMRLLYLLAGTLVAASPRRGAKLNRVERHCLLISKRATGSMDGYEVALADQRPFEQLERRYERLWVPEESRV